MNDETTTNSESEAAPAAEIDPEAERIAALEGEIAAAKERALYAEAETQNVRRRLEKEKADAVAYASTGFARDVLSVADNLQRAVAAIPPEAREDDAVKSIVTGVEMVAKELDSIFQRQGVTRIAAVGERLDPNRHQAMIEIESEEAPGTIVQEMQAGYMLRERLLRPSLVGVAKAAAEPAVNGKIDIDV